MNKTPYVCNNCGVSVITWGDGWKHANGGLGNRSCGRPEPIERAQWDAAMVEVLRRIRS